MSAVISRLGCRVQILERAGLYAGRRAQLTPGHLRRVFFCRIITAWGFGGVVSPWVGCLLLDLTHKDNAVTIKGVDMRFRVWLTDLSRVTCHYITGDDESWCSRAWRLSSEHTGWRMWVYVFGVIHCSMSNEYHNNRRE